MVFVQTETPEERFWRKVEKTDCCWLWTAGLFSNGYGQFWVAGQNRKAHVVAWEFLHGPVPEGMQLDHVRARGCFHKRCVNPDHLEPVTHGENVRRSTAGEVARERWRRFREETTHCPNGHEYTPENVYCYDGVGRACRTCASLKAKARRAKRHEP